jgi:hypothetical protein
MKKQIFYDMLDMAGRVFITVRHGEDVIVGRRGFLPQEKEKGIILVFNRGMTFTWNEEGISATLAFGSTAEKCFIPLDNIMTIFSPELNAQFTVFSEKKQNAGPQPGDDRTGEAAGSDEKVIKVDFSRKKQRQLK